ncbi:MAG: PD40 domain-containing protein [Bacteroidetes bacterium]|nr:PD40 domain-containing protein [Bacteroidota bacterium]
MGNYLPDGGWSEPVALPFFDDTMNIGTPCLSPDGNTTFFAATNPDGYGGADIYMSRRTESGWDAAYNAGQVINTSGNEVFPYFDSEGVMYFSSDKHPGLGGLDIFSATWKIINCSNIKNLEYPINSAR